MELTAIVEVHSIAASKQLTARDRAAIKLIQFEHLM